MQQNGIKILNYNSHTLSIACVKFQIVSYIGCGVRSEDVSGSSFVFSMKSLIMLIGKGYIKRAMLM